MITKILNCLCAELVTIHQFESQWSDYLFGKENKREVYNTSFIDKDVVKIIWENENIDIYLKKEI